MGHILQLILPHYYARCFRHLRMPDIDSIRKQVALHPERKLGLVIYRLKYCDDTRWVRFMDHLNTCVRLDLEGDGDGDIFPYIDRDFQKNLSLEGAENITRVSVQSSSSVGNSWRCELANKY